MTGSDPSATALFGQLVRFVHCVAQRGAAELSAHGLTPAQYHLLLNVSAHPGIAQYQLADRIGVTRGNVSQLVKRLESAGALVRHRDASTDELTLTPHGRALISTLRPQQERFLAAAFAALDADELASLHRIAPRLAMGCA